MSKPFGIKQYLEFIDEKKIMGAKCKCGHIDVPAQPICQKCHSTDREWVELPQKGELVGYTSIGVPATAFVNKGYNLKNPVAAGLVKLEGTNIVFPGRLISVDAKNPESIKIGEKYEVEWEPYEEVKMTRKGEVRKKRHNICWKKIG
ncbi:MAG: Zn-ribbon domain-containing OB-fold protein [Candidatus Hermodarchaeota archaeon]